MPNSETPKGMNNILHLLINLGYGSVVQDANEQLADLTVAMAKREGKGSLTLKIDFESSADNPQRLELTGSVSSVVPKGAKRAHTLYFAKDGKGLTRQDPQQPNLPFGMAEQEEAQLEVALREAAGMATADSSEY